MVDKKKKEDCCGCRACEQACPFHAIKMIEDDLGFVYPTISSELCKNCGNCDQVCGFRDDNKFLNTGDPVIIAARNRDTVVKQESTSGGVFTAISNYVLNNEGIVYGAAYGENLYVHHERAINVQERDLFRGSKYVQSDTEDTFSKTKEDLEAGHVVLYTGTPCQIAGLKYFLKNDYKNLITADVVCHGVPNAKVWREFLDLAEKSTGKRVVNVNFREKIKTGWHHPVTKLFYEDGKEHKFCGEQSFFQMFNTNLFLRPSCLYCKFISYKRVSDLSLADYWGIERFRKDFDDNTGTSMLLINTDKGRRVFEATKDQLDYFESDKEHCYQGRLQGRSYIHPETQTFWEEYKTKGLKYVLIKYTEYSPVKTFYKKAVQKVKRSILKKENGK